MTKKLRIRFIIFSMIALLVMQTMIILFSGYRTYEKIVVKADDVIDEILEVYPESLSIDARYFVVIVERATGSIRTDLSNIASIREQEAQAYAKQILNGEQERGFADTFRYRVQREPNQIVIVFLSRSFSFESLRGSVRSSILFSIVGMGVMLLLLVAAAFWVTRPIEEAYRKQKQFVTAASHELGTPLTVIKADTDILLADDPENEWLQDIDKQTCRMADMTHHLITLAKLDEEGGGIKRIRFPVSDVAEDVAGSYRAVAEQEHKRFVSLIEGDICFFGDENLIRQLFCIFLDNAFKYCPESGEIQMILKRHAQAFSICVMNTTDEMTSERMDRLFDRFYRSDHAAASQTKGYGLGLSIAEGIVKKHGGKIHAEMPKPQVFSITAIFK